MNEIELINMNGSQYLDSRDVAKMIGRRHDHLIRDIDGYISDIDQTPNLGADSFFIESSYTAGTGKTYKRYLFTKQGCEFVANKLTGKKGNQFTARYVDLFNKMKDQVLIPVQFNIPRTLPKR